MHLSTKQFLNWKDAMTSNTNHEFNISQTLGIDQSTDRKKRLKRWLMVSLLVIVIVTSAVVWKSTKKSNSMQYQTQKVQRGDLIVTVTATGALEPTNQVDVGSELSGIIKTVEVDYNDRVKVGQILARLDTDKLRAKVLQSKSALESARAKVLEAQATVKEAGDQLARLKQVWELSNNMVPSLQDLDAAQALLHRAKAIEARGASPIPDGLPLKLLGIDLDEIMPGRGDGLTAERRCQFPATFEAEEHLTFPLSHAEELWNRDLQRAIIRRLNSFR